MLTEKGIRRSKQRACSFYAEMYEKERSADLNRRRQHTSVKFHQLESDRKIHLSMFSPMFFRKI